MHLAGPIRRLLAYIVEDFIGTWFGIGIFQCIVIIETYLRPLSVCNGSVFCSHFGIPLFLLAGVVSGSCGAASNYLVRRLFLRQPIIPSNLFAYAVAGSVLWVGIGVLSFFLVILSNLDSTLGWSTGSAIIPSVIGVSIGTIMAMLPHNRYMDTMP